LPSGSSDCGFGAAGHAPDEAARGRGLRWARRRAQGRDAGFARLCAGGTNWARTCATGRGCCARVRGSRRLRRFLWRWRLGRIDDLLCRQSLLRPARRTACGPTAALRWIGDKNNTVHKCGGNSSGAGRGCWRGLFLPRFPALRAHNQVMQDLLAFNEDSMNATVHRNAQRAVVAMVSGNYFDVLGVRRNWPQYRVFDDRIGSAKPSCRDQRWRVERNFGRSPSVIGQTINVNQSLLTIVGVNPRGSPAQAGANLPGHLRPAQYAADSRSQGRQWWFPQ